MSSTVLQPIATLADLDAAIAQSARRTVVIFKHSPTCGVSAQAHESILELLAGVPPEADWYVVSVRANREISSAIAERFGVRHESPQVLIIDAGKVVWQASHFRVTGSAILQAVENIPAA